MKAAIILGLVLALAAGSAAQKTKCTLPIAKSPVIRGLQIGQMANDISIDGFAEAYKEEADHPGSEFEKVGLTMVQSYQIWNNDTPKEFRSEEHTSELQSH